MFYSVEISYNLGDILAYGIKSTPLRNMTAKKAIEYIHRQGGIAVCDHPYTNRHEGFHDHVFNYDFDAIELNGSLNSSYHELAKKAALKMDIPTIGGSDAHSLKQLNTFGTKFEDHINSIEDIVNSVKDKKCMAIRI